MKKSILMLLLSLQLPAFALFGEKGTPEEQRAEILTEKDRIVKKVAETNPEVLEKIESAEGYATFNALNVNLLLVATARGKGVVVDNQSGEVTFMSVTSIGGGLGAGLKDMRALMIFNDRSTMDQFVNTGWQFGASADASLKSGDKGGAIGEGIALSADEDGGTDTALGAGASEALAANTSIEIYRITEAGIALQATIAGTKYNQIEELNE
jgi:lipid-binding SYLF domain-containing protein